jgi:hypothetical protein
VRIVKRGWSVRGMVLSGSKLGSILIGPAWNVKIRKKDNLIGVRRCKVL